MIQNYLHRQSVLEKCPYLIIVIDVVVVWPVFLVAFVFLVGVEVGPVDGLDVFPQGAGISVPLGAAGRFTDVGFLKRQHMNNEGLVQSHRYPNLCPVIKLFN